MRKLLGLAVMLLSFFAVANNSEAYAKNNVVDNNTITDSIETTNTMSKIRMEYNTQTKLVSKMHLKFGGRIKKTGVDLDNYIYGICILSNGNKYNSCMNTITSRDLSYFKESKYVLEFNEELAKQKDNELDYYQFAWVITNTLDLSYEAKYTAIIFEATKNYETIKYAKQTELTSLVDVVDKYLKLDDSTLGSNPTLIKEVLRGFKNNYELPYFISREQLINSIDTNSGNYPNDDNFVPFVHSWSDKENAWSINPGYKSGNYFRIFVNHNHKELTISLMPSGSTSGSYDRDICQTHNLVISLYDIVNPNEVVVINNMREVYAEELKGVPAEALGHQLYVFIWGEKIPGNGRFIPVYSNTLVLPKEADSFLFYYSKNNEPQWGTNDSNVLFKSADIILEQTISVDRAKVCKNMKWEMIDDTLFDLYAYTWVNGVEPVDCKWTKVVDDKFTVKNRFDMVIFVVVKKGVEPSFADGIVEGQTSNLKLNKGYVNW